MRWLAFVAVVIPVIILQTAIAGRLAVGGVRPEWLFALVVFFGLYGARGDAWLAGWLIGVGADLTSIERMGLFAISYCLVAVIVNSLRDLVFLKSHATHFFVTLLAGVVLQAAFVAYRSAFYPNSMTMWQPVVLHAGGSALYAATWAVFIHHYLLKASRLLGLHTSQYTHRRSDPAARTGMGAHV